jgi:membrane fusion protein (multidrug efflux system)
MISLSLLWDTHAMQGSLIKTILKRIRLYFVVSILACILFLIFTHAHAKEFPSTLPAPPSDITAVEKTPEYVVIKSSDQATFSSETAASVADISVKEGSKFKAGDILLQLDCRLQQAELKKALAVQAATKMAKSSAKKLKSYGSISEFELVKANSDAEAADADVDKLRAIVEKCVIKAPFNGSVSEVSVHSHESVKPGDPLLKIVNTENLELELQVPSSWLAWLHVGSVFYVHLNDNNKKITAKITRIDPQIEPVSQSVKIIGSITPPDSSLLPGMSGQAIFPDNPNVAAKSKQ